MRIAHYNQTAVSSPSWNTLHGRANALRLEQDDVLNFRGLKRALQINSIKSTSCDKLVLVTLSLVVAPSRSPRHHHTSIVGQNFCVKLTQLGCKYSALPSHLLSFSVFITSCTDVNVNQDTEGATFSGGVNCCGE